MSQLSIRRLDPDADWELYREAYEWRDQKRAASDLPTEFYIPFDVLTNPQPNEVLMGMFNGKLQAAFLLQDRGRNVVEAHFTTMPGIKQEDLVAGTLTIKNKLFEYGTREIYGWLREKHARLRHPVRRFAETVGFFPTGENMVFGEPPHFHWWRKFSSKR